MPNTNQNITKTPLKLTEKTKKKYIKFVWHIKDAIHETRKEYQEEK